MRREFLENAPDSELGSGDYATNRVCWETSIVKAMLEPAKVLELIGIPKKQRSYYCPQLRIPVKKATDCCLKSATQCRVK